MSVKRLNTKKRNLFNEETVKIAVERINATDDTRLTIRKAANIYNIPLTTLYRRTYKTPNFIGSGSATILSRATEEMLVYIIKSEFLNFLKLSVNAFFVTTKLCMFLIIFW